MKSSRKINFLCFLRKRKKTTANCTAKFCLTKLRDDNFPGMADDPASLENCRFHPRNPQFCCAIGGVIFLFCISKFCIRIAVCLHLNSSLTSEMINSHLILMWNTSDCWSKDVLPPTGPRNAAAFFQWRLLQHLCCYLPEVVYQCLKQITEKKSFKFSFFSVEIHNLQ